MSGNDPEPDEKPDAFSEAVDGIFEQGWDHPLTKPALLGIMIGGFLGAAALDGAGGWLMGCVFGGMIAILIKIEEK
jgi:hypothetical protein